MANNCTNPSCQWHELSKSQQEQLKDKNDRILSLETSNGDKSITIGMLVVMVVVLLMVIFS